MVLKVLAVAAAAAMWPGVTWGGGAEATSPEQEGAFVRSAELEAEVGRDGSSALVRVVYTLDVPAVTPLRIQLLGFGEARTSVVWLGDARQGTWLELDPGEGSMRTAAYTLNLAAPDSAFRLEVRYRLRRALKTEGPSAEAVLPVLVVALPPAPDAGEVFQARVALPEGWRLLDAFPSGLRAGTPGADGVRYASVSLPVVPSVVRVRARTDGAWRPGLPFVLDVGAVLALVIFAGVGFRYLSARQGARFSGR